LDVTAKQRFRYRNLIELRNRGPKRLIEVFVIQRDERPLRSIHGARIRTCRTFNPTVGNSDHLHLLASPARGGPKRIEYTIPTTIEIESCYIENQPRIMTESRAFPVPPVSLEKTDPISMQVSYVHV
jgi:hypothetical protein